MPKLRLDTAAQNSTELKPYWQTLDGESVKFYHGDVIDVLSKIPEKSVQMVVTSPPYWALRDYGVEGQIGSEPLPDCGTMGKAQCGQCFVCKMVEVFTQVHRVLRDDGTLWMNLGSTYLSKSVTSDNMILRDDLTTEEKQYVLEELAKCQSNAQDATGT